MVSTKKRIQGGFRVFAVENTGKCTRTCKDFCNKFPNGD